MSNPKARIERAAQLERQSRAPDLPWSLLIEHLCQATLHAERTGDSAVALRDIARLEASGQTVRVLGFNLPTRHPTIAFADGAGGKSTIAVKVGGDLAAAGYRALYLDWELTGEEHAERFWRMFGEDRPGHLFYRRCTRPLIYEIDAIKRIVRQEGIDYAIFDSIGFAVAGRPEDAEAALAYFRSVNALRIGTLHTAHINRSEHGDQKPFGSSFFHNSARSTFFLKASEADQDTLNIGVWNRKCNLGRKQPPFAITIRFEHDLIKFSHGDITAVDDFAPQVPITQRVNALLRAGSLTREEIEAELDAKPETVRRTIDRGIKNGHLVKFPSLNGPERIGLKARAS